MAELEIAATSADLIGAPTESEPLLSVRLRRRTSGEVIAIEPVRVSDLTDAIGEMWMEGYLRRGFAEMAMEEVEARLRCAVPFCKGQVRIALVHDDTEGFVGGLA